MEDEIESDQVLVPAFIKLRKESLAATVTFSMVNVQGMFLSDAMDGSLDLPLSFAFGVGHHCRFAGRVSDAHFSLSLSLDYSRDFFTLMARPASWASSQVSKGSIRAQFQTPLHDASSIVGCSCMQQASASAFLSHDPIVCCTHQYKNGAIGIQSDGMHRWRLSACWSLLTSVPSFKLS